MVLGFSAGRRICCPWTADNVEWVRRVEATMRTRGGFILVLFILGVMAMAFLAVFMQTLGSSYTSQVKHVDEHTRAALICEAVINRVVARIREKPYSQRFFRGTPHTETRQPLLEGTYDLFVKDSPGKLNQVDLFTRVTFGRVIKVWFSRIKIRESILDSTGRLLLVIFGELPAADFANAGSSAISAKIDRLIADGAANPQAATDLAAKLSTVTSLGTILGEVHALPPGSTPEVFDPPRPVPQVSIPPSTPPAVPTPTPPTPTGEQVVQISDQFTTHFVDFIQNAVAQAGGVPIVDQIMNGGIAQGGGDDTLRTFIRSLAQTPEQLAVLKGAFAQGRTLLQPSLNTKIADRLQHFGLQRYLPGVPQLTTDLINRMAFLLDRTR